MAAQESAPLVAVEAPLVVAVEVDAATPRTARVSRSLVIVATLVAVTMALTARSSIFRNRLRSSSAALSLSSSTSAYTDDDDSTDDDGGQGYFHLPATTAPTPTNAPTMSKAPTNPTPAPNTQAPTRFKYTPAPSPVVPLPTEWLDRSTP